MKLSWWSRIFRRRRNLGEVPKATVGITVRPIRDDYGGGRNVRILKLCGKHHRMWIKCLDSMVDYTIERHNSSDVSDGVACYGEGEP